MVGGMGYDYHAGGGGGRVGGGCVVGLWDGCGLGKSVHLEICLKRRRERARWSSLIPLNGHNITALGST